MSSKRVLSFRLWGRGCSCAMEKKRERERGRETVFLLGGLFGKTAALPTAASLQKALKESSPLLSLNPSILPNELLPLVSGNLTCLPLSPPFDRRRPTARLQGCGRGVMHRSMGNVQSRRPQSTHTETGCTLGTLTFLTFVFLLYYGCNPACDVRLRTRASAQHTSGWEDFSYWKADRDLRGCKFYELLSPRITLSVKNPKRGPTLSSLGRRLTDKILICEAFYFFLYSYSRLYSTMLQYCLAIQRHGCTLSPLKCGNTIEKNAILSKMSSF